LGLISKDKCLTLQEKACIVAFIFFLIQWGGRHVIYLNCKKKKRRHVVWNSQNLTINLAGKTRFIVFSPQNHFKLIFNPKHIRYILGALLNQFIGLQKRKKSLKLRIKPKLKIFLSSYVFF
jgi:hypothetical protein